MDVSVVIPVFNGEATIANAIESALVQKFDGEFEIVVVNDGSTDGTAEVVRVFGDRIKVVAQENRGLAAARNAGARNAIGKYLAWLDADDEWREDKLAKTVSVLESDSNCGLVYSDALTIDNSGNPSPNSYIPDAFARAPSLDDLLREWWYILPSCAVIRRSLFDSIEGFCERFGRRGRGGEDYLMWLLARERAPFQLVREPLVTYRVSSAGEALRRRFLESARVHSISGAGLCAESLVEGERQFVEIARERWGRRASLIQKNCRAYQFSVLLSAGMISCREGNLTLARGCFIGALRRRPFYPKVWARLAWALLPAALGRNLAARLPSRFASSLKGPPFVG